MSKKTGSSAAGQGSGKEIKTNVMRLLEKAKIPYEQREYEVDENDHRVWEAYYDDIHAPIECAAGYSSVERGFDSQGRLVSERYLDRYNKLTNNAQGVAGWNGYYDSEGNLVITGRYDKDRNNLPTDNQ